MPNDETILNRLYSIVCAPRDPKGLIEGTQPANVLVVAQDSMEAIRKTVKWFQSVMPDKGIVAIELATLSVAASPNEAVVLG